MGAFDLANLTEGNPPPFAWEIARAPRPSTGERISSVGGTVVIFLAGLQGMSRTLYEAAALGGAGSWRQFRHITVPMMSPVICFNLIIGIIESFQVFTQAYVMTGGGPQNATLFYVLYLFKQGFGLFRMGYAAAMAWILFLAAKSMIAIFNARRPADMPALLRPPAVGSD
jgi:ABC-type sugar transport system permease subunit